MGSLDERMKVMKRIQIDATEDFVVEIMHNGISVGEYVLAFEEVEYNISSRKSRVKISVMNPKTFSITHYEPK